MIPGLGPIACAPPRDDREVSSRVVIPPSRDGKQVVIAVAGLRCQPTRPWNAHLRGQPAGVLVGQTERLGNGEPFRGDIGADKAGCVACARKTAAQSGTRGVPRRCCQLDRSGNRPGHRRSFSQCLASECAMCYRYQTERDGMLSLTHHRWPYGNANSVNPLPQTDEILPEAQTT